MTVNVSIYLKVLEDCPQLVLHQNFCSASLVNSVSLKTKCQKKKGSLMRMNIIITVDLRGGTSIDNGGENMAVGKYTIWCRGENRGSFLTGPSARNAY